MTRTHLRFAPLLFPLALLGCGTDGAAHPGAPESPQEQEPPPAGADEWAPLPEGANRTTMTLAEFDVEPGGETYRCQNFRNPFGGDVAILQTQSIMSPGSHHLAVFRVDANEDGPLEECSGLEFHTVILSAQTAKARTKFPADVGAFQSGTAGVRLNAHYLNLTDQPIRASVKVAFDTVEPDAVANTTARIYMNDGTLDIPPGGGTAGGTLAIPAEVGDVQLISIQSHMHRRSVHFTASGPSGETIYETDEWHEPPEVSYTPPIPLPAGSSVSWHCDVTNETGEHITFGESANTNEMCVFTGYYYPAPDGKALVGDLAVGATLGLTL